MRADKTGKAANPARPKRRFQHRARQATDKAQLREKFIEIARGEFAQRDVSSVSLRRIAAAAGYSQGTLYQYFPSKVALLIAVKQENFQEIVGRMLAIAAAAKDGRTRLERVMLAYIDYWERHPDHFKSLFSMSGTVEDRRMPDGTLFGESPIARQAFQVFADSVASFFADRGVELPVRLVWLLTSAVLSAAHGTLSLPLGTPSMKWPRISLMTRMVVEAVLHSWETRIAAARLDPAWPRIDQSLFLRPMVSPPA